MNRGVVGQICGQNATNMHIFDGFAFQYPRNYDKYKFPAFELSLYDGQILKIYDYIKRCSELSSETYQVPSLYLNSSNLLCSIIRENKEGMGIVLGSELLKQFVSIVDLQKGRFG